ncbi:MAG TPA: glycoside hydrolase domain-containing protein, partial [Planctomycetota bacterium]|nr:glycoside hydrolase domain-containing protein [Planctomycetota bacterium]
MSLLMLSVALSAAEVVLDTTGYRRVHYTLRPPVLLRDGKPETLPTVSGPTPLPPAGWQETDFDDSGWLRLPGRPFPATKRYGYPEEIVDAGFTDTEKSSSALALLCVREKFHVADPAAVKDLKLSLEFRGGVVVTVNGKELTRSHIAADAGPETLAEAYPDEAFLAPDGSLLCSFSYDKTVRDRIVKDPEIHRRWLTRNRHVRELAIPPGMLRKGTNVLAFEIHRSPQHPALYDTTRKLPAYYMPWMLWSTCALVRVRLVAEAGVEPNATRPKGLQVWNSSPMNPDFDVDWGDPTESLRPMRLVGTRGGSVSGKVVVGSDGTIRGLTAQLGALKSAPGPGQADGATIPADKVRVRYALPSGWSAMPDGRYPLVADLFDELAETAPAEVPVSVKPVEKKTSVDDGAPAWVPGAVVPVWVTVEVPDSARPGEYSATLTLSADGVRPVTVPVTLSVAAWRSPAPNAFHTIVDLIQSPESVALQYDVPLWSEEHWKLVSKSFDRLGYVGNWTLYVPLIAQTNQGNVETMVRWVRRAPSGKEDPLGTGDGTWTHDFSVMERYLDTAVEHMGRPKIICLYLWDLFIGGVKTRHEDDTRPGHGAQQLAPGEIPVSVLDKATGMVSTATIGTFDEKGLALWKPLANGLMKRLKDRGLEGTVMLGLASDGRPDKEIVTVTSTLFPDVPWMRHGHQQWKELGTNDVPIGYQANVQWMKYLEDVEHGKFSCYGWNRPQMWAMYYRTGDPNLSLTMSRLIAEINIQGYQRGFGRVGLDFWPVLEDARKRKHSIQGRFPQADWRQLNAMVRSLVPAGPDGASGSVRLEMMREGLQEAEARIVVERALVTPELRARLGDDLVRRAEAMIDERARAFLPKMETQQSAGFGDERYLK